MLFKFGITPMYDGRFRVDVRWGDASYKVFFDRYADVTDYVHFKLTEYFDAFKALEECV